MKAFVCAAIINLQVAFTTHSIS